MATPMKKVSAREAAVQVLRRAGKPMKPAEIVERVLKMEGVHLGHTPAAMIAAILALENKKPDGLFRRTAPRTYTLRATKNR